MSEELEIGDRVYVDDAGLASLREIMRRATGEEPAPNHHGTIDEIEDDEAFILFDDGIGASYPLSVTHLLEVSS